MRSMLLVAAGLLLAVPVLSADKPKSTGAEYLSSEATTKLNLPFSEATRVGNVLYLSGVVGLVPGTRTVIDGGVEVQTKQVLENIRTVLERYGSSMDNVFKCTVMMTNMADWPKMNAVYTTFFPKHFPARSAIGANGLALGAAVEIECMATTG